MIYISFKRFDDSYFSQSGSKSIWPMNDLQLCNSVLATSGPPALSSLTMTCWYKAEDWYDIKSACVFILDYRRLDTTINMKLMSLSLWGAAVHVPQPKGYQCHIVAFLEHATALYRASRALQLLCLICKIAKYLDNLISLLLLAKEMAYGNMAIRWAFIWVIISRKPTPGMIIMLQIIVRACKALYVSEKLVIIDKLHLTLEYFWRRMAHEEPNSMRISFKTPKGVRFCSIYVSSPVVSNTLRLSGRHFTQLNEALPPLLVCPN